MKLSTLHGVELPDKAAIQESLFCPVCPSVEDIFITGDHDAALLQGPRGNADVRHRNRKSVPEGLAGMEGGPGAVSDQRARFVDAKLKAPDANACCCRAARGYDPRLQQHHSTRRGQIPP